VRLRIRTENRDHRVVNISEPAPVVFTPPLGRHGSPAPPREAAPAVDCSAGLGAL